MKTISYWCLFVLTTGLASLGAAGQVQENPPRSVPVPQGARRAPDPAPKGRLFKQTARNTVIFDHYNLQPAQDDPMVLSVADGDFFQVRIRNTDTTLFDYSISALPDQEVPTTITGATGNGLAATRFEETAVTMRHSEAFARYRVTITPRTGLAVAPSSKDAASGVGLDKVPATTPPRFLYPATFDVWVKTVPGFEVSFTGGFAVSGLRAPQFFIKTDDKGTSDTKDDTKTVESDAAAPDSFRPDTIAVANFRYPAKFWGIGIAVGVGLNNDADPRYFVGPSYYLGRNLLITGGWSGGRLDRLPNGQELHQAPINGDNTLTTLGRSFRNTAFIAFAFSFTPKAEDNFKGAFGSTQKAGAAAVAPAADTSDVTGSTDTPIAAALGTYTALDKSSAVVTESGGGISVKLSDQTLTLKKEGAVFTGTVGTDQFACSVESQAAANGKVKVLSCKKGEAEIFRGERPEK